MSQNSFTLHLWLGIKFCGSAESRQPLRGSFELSSGTVDRKPLSIARPSHKVLELRKKNVRHLGVSFNKALVFLLSFFIINIYKIYMKR